MTPDEYHRLAALGQHRAAVLRLNAKERLDLAVWLSVPAGAPVYNYWLRLWSEWQPAAPRQLVLL